MAITLGYWKLRGRAQPIRYLLAHAGADFTEVQYELGSTDWHGRDKAAAPLDFPNLPYLYDGDVRLSQSNAILRYLGRKYGLDGETEGEKIRIDLTETQVQDYATAFSTVNYNPTTTKEALDHFRDTSLVDHLKALSRFLGTAEYFSGSLSYADFKAYEYLYMMHLFAPEQVAAHENLIAFLKRIESLPGVAAFIQSDRHIEWPISAPFAKWGNSNSNPELDPANK